MKWHSISYYYIEVKQQMKKKKKYGFEKKTFSYKKLLRKHPDRDPDRDPDRQRPRQRPRQTDRDPDRQTGTIITRFGHQLIAP